MSGLIRFFRRISGDERGNTAIIFALSILPVILLVGAAVDLSGMHGKRSALQSALDAAALAAAKMPYNSSEADVIETATRFANANFDGEIQNLQVVRADDSITVTGESPADLMFLSGFGMDDRSVSTMSQATRGAHKVEVVMVLDNSGSMRGSKLTSLKRSARTLVDTLTSTEAKPGTTKIGLVPFTAAINVGPDNFNDATLAAWLDKEARADQHTEIFDRNLNRFTALQQIGQQWGGCVETRPYPLDVNDTPPNNAIPETLFQIYFAPDEPDLKSGSSDYYPNNYLIDWEEPEDDKPDDPCAGLSGWALLLCRIYTADDDDDDDDDNGGDWDDDGNDWYDEGDYNNGRRSDLETGQLYAPKYRLSDYNAGSDEGPNAGCLAKPIQPLTERFSEIRSAIEAMDANGNTNIHEGVAWGWRALSPTPPFTEGASYDDRETKKFLILLTDGANNITAQGGKNHNKSIYSPYGYARQENPRFLTSPDTTHEIRQEMDSRTAETCENAKAAGITVFTIAFDVNDDDIEDLMEDCASGSNRYFLSPNPGDLEETFETIVNEITELRLSQ